jgi:hypothetical protein
MNGAKNLDALPWIAGDRDKCGSDDERPLKTTHLPVSIAGRPTLDDP